MSHFSKCDQCGQTRQDGDDRPEWIYVSLPGAMIPGAKKKKTPGHGVDKLFCSVACFGGYGDLLRAAEQARAAVKAAKCAVYAADEVLANAGSATLRYAGFDPEIGHVQYTVKPPPRTIPGTRWTGTIRFADKFDNLGFSLNADPPRTGGGT